MRRSSQWLLPLSITWSGSLTNGFVLSPALRSSSTFVRSAGQSTSPPLAPTSSQYPGSNHLTRRYLSHNANTDQPSASQESQHHYQYSGQSDTIFALSSGQAHAHTNTALAILRISGPQAHQVLKTLSPQSPLPKPRMATLRKLYDVATHQMLDHALVLRFDGPHTATGEDLVELHCHGSRAVVQGLLETLAKIQGCRYAEAGEFTQRAYEHGKMDLVQVEALADVLTADTQAQLSQALQQLDGKLSELYDHWRTELIAGLAHAEAVIDFGDDERLDDDSDDHDGDQMAGQWTVWGTMRERMCKLQEHMKRHLADHRRGEIVRDGVKVAIVGPPNAGKSSLFNELAQQDAAMVSPTAGTTRDVLTLALDLGGVKCILQDTAGVQETDDMLELEGIRRATKAAAKADVVVAMVDATNLEYGMATVQRILGGLDTSEEDCEDGASSSPRRTILVLNKMDLTEMEGDSTTTTTQQERMDDTLQDWSSTFGAHGSSSTHTLSCVTQQGMDSFLEALTQQVLERTSADDGNAQGAIITRVRHRQHVQAAVEALERFEDWSQQGSMAVDMAAEELRLASSELGRITGAVDVEDVLDVLFADFCIGK
eukprot:Nitzschia sp. Nitz4//scaffold16_size188269//47178//48977//NITZ4_001783-RA/size188269-processed-gene-0.49-mRNA-1//-1//CDS//3329538493//6213//frame0